ncbi:glycoside hydrolase family 16 protein [Microvirga aerophila]|uniref:glycoside hydrolase family 16 protein n=1 Tax=Microvirga aerophila TaxID=670291 RepID=UPI000DEF41E1|nr:glycoside hydrolase family 16 protein [Microvirga aerophila]
MRQAVAGVLVFIAVAAHPRVSASMDLTGYKLVFDEEFNGTSIDKSKWAEVSSSQQDFGQGNKPNQQLEWNSFANASVQNGVLTITARREKFISKSGREYSWTSSLLTTSPSFAFQYGYIEERAMFPADKGFWPAFWTWQTPGYAGPGTQETDVYEFYSNDHARLYLTSHVGDGGSHTLILPFDPTSGYHTYGADISPSGTKWYIDGQLVFSAPGTHTAPANLVTNLAVYARRAPDLEVKSASKKVDYIRVYSRDQSLPVITPQLGYDGPSAAATPSSRP